MRNVLLALGLALLPLSSATLAQTPDAPDPLALIDRAIKAGGGIERVAKFKALTVKASARMPDGEGTVEGTFCGPDQMRLTIEGSARSGNRKGTILINGRRGWFKAGDQDPVELPNQDLGGMKDLLHAVCLADLLSTLKGKDYKLTPLAPAQGGDDSPGIRVTHPTYKEVHLFFDRSSGLVSNSMVKLPTKSGGMEWCECFFSDYKEFDGVRHFTRLRIRQGGEDVMIFNVQRLTLLEKPDAGFLSLPK
jgi:hypothetical protein